MQNKVCLLSGHSGVGKSTLINKINLEVPSVTINDKDIDNIQVDSKQKPSKEDAKKSHRVEKNRIAKSVEVESLQKDKPNIGDPKESKRDIVKETAVKEKVKSAKDWGRASNDPRNKS